MSKNPLQNAILAIAYIIIVVTLISSAPAVLGDTEDNIFMPIGMLSLLVLSVAIMAYIFFYQPVVMLLDGERKKAITLFLHTVGIFAIATVIVLLVSVVIPLFVSV